MSSILRVSESAGLALHTVSLLVRHGGRRFSNTEIAELLDCSTNTLSKVLQRLVKAGLVHSVRGPSGGFEMAVKPTEANVLQVYEAVDGPISSCTCLLGQGDCGRKHCILGGVVKNVQDMVSDSFSKTNLQALADSMELGDEIYGNPEHN